MSKVLPERLREEAAKQRVERGDYLTYGTPDPWLRDAADLIEKQQADLLSALKDAGRQQARADQQAEWALREAKRCAELEAIAEQYNGTMADRNAEIEQLTARVDVLREALEKIAGMNDLSGVPDCDLESAARGSLYECELIASQALKEAVRS